MKSVQMPAECTNSKASSSVLTFINNDPNPDSQADNSILNLELN